MKRPKLGDRVLTFKVNLDELGRTNTNREEHPFDTAVEVLRILLNDIAANPAVVGKSVVWNGVDCGELRIDWKAP